MIQLILSVLMAGSWTGTFTFEQPVFTEEGMPLIDGTVNLHSPGVPLYPVRTVFIPVPPGSSPELTGLETTSGNAVGITGGIQRAGILRGEGLSAFEEEVPPVESIPEPVVLRGVYPLAGTTVAVADIYPCTERGFFSTVGFSLEWDDGGNGVRMDRDHLLRGLAQGDVVWPAPVEREVSPFWGKPWARIAIEETGGYSLTCGDLEDAGCNVSGAPLQSLALFSGPGTQFADAQETEHQLLPVACTVDDVNGNGFFDGNDEILFFGGALNRFEYIGGSLTWLFHRYAVHRIYWLTWGGDNGARMGEVQGVPDGSPQWGSTVSHMTHLEDGAFWRPRWETRNGWFWKRLWSGEQEALPVDLGHTAGSGDVNLTFAVSSGSSFIVNLQGYGEREFSGSGIHQAFFEDVSPSADELVFSFSSSDPDAEMLIDYLDLDFPVALTPSKRRLFFPGERGRYNFSFAGGERAFDTSDLMNPVIITGTEVAGGALRFSHMLSDSTSLSVLDDNSWMSPDSIAPAAPGRLVGTISSGDRLLVVPPEFSDDVNELENLLESMNLSVVTATTREIYDEFGQGVKDPGAIRSAVRWGMDSWTSPLSTVILCGDGHYDPLGYTTTIPDLIPPMVYVRGTSSYPAWASEDWFVKVHENSLFPEIPVARIPAANASAFSAVVSKSRIYAMGETGGSWSSRFVFLADDEWGQQTYPSKPRESEHTEWMESVIENRLTPVVRPERFYLVDFPWPPGTTYESAHPEKPDARNALIDTWNRGMACLLFLGHGSANQIAHEKVMLGDDPASLENGVRLPYALFMSCDLGKFFVPGVDCVSEKLVYHPGGGAIASVGATGGTTYPGNAMLGGGIIESMVQENNSLGYSFWAGKLATGLAGNSGYYVFLGCPDLHLQAGEPELQVDLQGDTLLSGEVNTVSGTAVSSEGLVLLEVSESDIPWQYTMLGGGVIDYFRQGGTAWRGRASLSDGHFTAMCMIPYSSSTGDLARADGAAVVPGGVELGADAPLVLVEGDPAQDLQGPDVEMWISGQQGVQEPVVTGEGLLEAELSDESGINFLGRTGNSIQLFIDGDEFDLSDAFSYNTGSTTTGRLQYTLTELAQGEHTLILRVMDGAGNLSGDTLKVVSTEAGEVAIQQHLVYPSPGGGTRCFSFTLSTSAYVRVSVYTTAGRRIRTLSSMCAQGYNQIIWDGLDADGDIPASGAYIYRIEAQTESGMFSQSSSVTGVLATVN